jgi:hypothetical protein
MQTHDGESAFSLRLYGLRVMVLDIGGQADAGANAYGERGEELEKYPPFIISMSRFIFAILASSAVCLLSSA